MKAVVRALASMGVKHGDKYWPGVDTDVDLPKSELDELISSKKFAVVFSQQEIEPAQEKPAPVEEPKPEPSEEVSSEEAPSEKPRRKRW